jgi:hypothetical protein
MVDPTSDHHEDIDEEDAPNCTVCDDAIINDATHRVITWIEDDSVETAHFCDDDCRLSWDGD